MLRANPYKNQSSGSRFITWLGCSVSETQKLIMLPGPTNVPPRVMRAMIKPLMGHRGPDFKEILSQVISKTKKVFQTKEDLFVLTTSGTGATECALQNLIDDGDKIIVNVNGFFSERAWDKISAKKQHRSFYLDLPMYKKYMGDGFTPFTPAVSLFYALNEACDMILEEGLPARFERHRICAEAVYNSMEALGLGLMAEPESRSHTVAAVACPTGIEDGKLRELIRTKYGIDLGGSLEKWKGKMFRIGIMGNVGSPEIMSTVSAVASATADLGFKGKMSEALEAARRALARLPARMN